MFGLLHFSPVRTYADHGKSGLRLDGRDALKRLIDDVRAGRADFSAVLVYDVSRWGRFQDADESAYYESTTRTLRSIEFGSDPAPNLSRSGYGLTRIEKFFASIRAA